MIGRGLTWERRRVTGARESREAGRGTVPWRVRESSWEKVKAKKVTSCGRKKSEGGGGKRTSRTRKPIHKKPGRWGGQTVSVVNGEKRGEKKPSDN